MNSKIKTGSMFLMAAVLVAGTISMTIPSSFAQYYEDPYADPYAKDHKKTSVNVQKINCHNSNTNINGVDVNQFLDQNGATATEAQQLENGPENGNGNGLLGDGGLNIDRNLVNICLNINANGQIDSDGRIPVIIRE